MKNRMLIGTIVYCFATVLAAAEAPKNSVAIGRCFEPKTNLEVCPAQAKDSKNVYVIVRDKGTHTEKILPGHLTTAKNGHNQAMILISGTYVTPDEKLKSYIEHKFAFMKLTTPGKEQTPEMEYMVDEVEVK